MNEISGSIIAKGMKIGLVASRFNSFLVEQLVKGAVDAYTRSSGDESQLTLVKVPGAYEMPVVADALAKGGCDAVVCLGAVIQGATAHAGLINSATSEAFTRISVKTGIPVIDGIVSSENLEQAIERCGTKQGNKGFSAMQSAIEMVDVMRKLAGKGNAK